MCHPGVRMCFSGGGHLSRGPLKCLYWSEFCGGCVVIVLFCESGGGGNRTRDLTCDTAHTSHIETAQICANAKHIKALPHAVSPAPLQKPALPEHPHDISLHQKCALCVPHSLPDDLCMVVAAWESLPDAVKTGILAMVKAVPRQ